MKVSILDTLQVFIIKVERQQEVKIIRSFKGNKFMANMMKRDNVSDLLPNFFKKFKNYIKYTTPGFPWHNGGTKRHNRTFMEMVTFVISL